MVITMLNVKESSSANRSAYTASQRQAISISDLLALGVGLSSVIYINIGGNLYLAEIFLLLLLPYLIFKRRNLLQFGYFKTIIFLGGVWLLSQIITDLYRSTSATDIIKGWALITVLLTNFLALYLLVFPSSRRIALGLLGFAIGTMLQPVLQPIGINMLMDPWKFGVGQAVALLVAAIAALWSSAKQHKIVWWNVILIVIALFSFYVRSRSLGGIVLITALSVWFRFTRIGRSFALHLNNPVNIILGFILFLSVALGIIQMYGFAAEQGYFGEGSRFIYQVQSSGKFGIMLGGRTEWWPAVHALMDSPVIGYGSYARDTKYGLYLYDLINLGYDTTYLQLDNYLALYNSIPTHSHILQGWIWAGLAGAIFWIFTFGVIVRGMIMAYRRPTLLLSATLFLGVSALWNIFFSPLSNIGRLQWAFVLVTILYALVNKPVFKDTDNTRNFLN